MSTPVQKQRVADQIVRRALAKGAAEAEVVDVGADRVRVVVAGPWSNQDFQDGDRTEVVVDVADGQYVGRRWEAPHVEVRAGSEPVGGWPEGLAWRRVADWAAKQVAKQVSA